MYYNYEILSTENIDYKFVIFSKSIDTPLRDINNVCKLIAEKHPSKCKILFDMLLNIGNTSERFVEATFDGNCIEKSSLQYVELDKNSEYRRIATDYMSNNIELLEVSLLNSIQKTMINKGIVI